MNIRHALFQPGLALTFCCCLISFAPAFAAEANTSIAPVIQAGFALWPRGGAAMALDIWQKGGLIEGERKVAAEASFFKRLEQAIGAYKSYEIIETKKIGQTSQVVYISIGFERAAIYARFLLYQREQDWVVQNMDFSAKPEALVPWLAFAGTSAAE